MNNFDVQRVENAIWTLEQYRNKLIDTDVDIIVDGVSIGVSDALKVLDYVLYELTK